ncbi:hypothetical protein P1S61_13030 [Streptomyces sp. ME08-AFT2]|uniref:hypothetical protein n=1 Tax=Streptomyces sp. ME08-AFT2 TaxID=3028683 RepID=UPI0029A37384|nr:hypothetical protein [Streptomyces sp. ME08-AFT2]MDX3309996.1 hypothetical protein [Streptomyces sp. ME08-AFT2]
MTAPGEDEPVRIETIVVRRPGQDSRHPSADPDERIRQPEARVAELEACKR